jgi:dihydroxyacetone kinase-like predicted kinase
VKHLDGRQIFNAFSSGAIQVIDRQDDLNRINVFPVPDGDTGTNLAAALSHAVGQLGDDPFRDKQLGAIPLRACAPCRQLP